MLEIMGYGICRLRPNEYYDIALSELLRMTKAITNYNLMKVGKYKRKRSKTENLETLEWLKSEVDNGNDSR